ncbi:MAG: hypothetical protein HY928_13990 [Elusimicrobia bacterium]|nr:hypothetical protein [Elusimicrobiota bacterium]
MDAELSLSEYWGIVRKRRAAVLGVAGICVAATFSASLTLDPRYRAEAIIKYEPPLPAMMGGGDFSALAMPAVIQTQVSLLQSEDMRQRLGGKLKRRPDEVGALYEVSKVGASALISITSAGPDPAQAAVVANLVGETFVEWDLQSRSQKVTRAIGEIKTRQKTLQSQLQRLEAQRRQFLENHETTGLSQAVATQLLELDNRRKELERKFTDRHPDIIKLDSRIQNMRDKLAMMPAEQEELLRINRDIAVIEGTFIELAKQLEQKKIEEDSTLSFVSIVSRAVPPERPYFPNIPLLLFGGGLGALFLGVLAAFLLESLDISITTIEEIEKIMGAPVLAVIPHFGSSDRWEEVLQTLRLRSRVDESRFRAMLAFRFGPKSPNIEVYHGMRVNIQAQLGRSTATVLTFTSTGVAEGKTLTSANFCLAAANAGLKTLLVAADIRRPTPAQGLRLPAAAGPGRGPYWARSVAFGAAFHRRHPDGGGGPGAHRRLPEHRQPPHHDGLGGVGDGCGQPVQHRRIPTYAPRDADRVRHGRVRHAACPAFRGRDAGRQAYRRSRDGLPLREDRPPRPQTREGANRALAVAHHRDCPQ